MKTLQQPIGIIKAEGVGPEIIDCALSCLHEIEKLKDIKFNFIEYKGPAPATEFNESAYSKIKKFYSAIKSKNGCILRAAIYARIVYKLRQDFNLICKPIYFEPIPELFDDSLLKKEIVQNLNVLLIRENAQGLLFSKEKVEKRKNQRIMYGTFTYEENKIKSLVEYAFEQASKRNNVLHLFIKGDLWRKLTPLWLEAVESTNKKYPKIKFDWDHADTGFADLLHHPKKYDVVVALGIAGDIIADPLATLLYGSHAIVPSANIDPKGFMVFQTVHGTAYAIAGQNKANPIGAIRAAAMMLRLFFKMEKEAYIIENSVRKVLAQGHRTIDMYRPDLGHKLAGTNEMGELIANEISKN